MRTFNEVERGQFVASTAGMLRDGGFTLKSIVQRIETIIDHRMWESRQIAGGKVVELPSLRALITTPKLDGMGEDPELIERLLKDDPRVLAKWREAIVGEHGGDHGHGHREDGTFKNADEAPKRDKITLGAEPERGTSKSYLAARLKRDAPEVFERLCAGEIRSTRAAAIEAGIVRVPTLVERAVALFGRMTEAEKEEFLEAIS